MRLKDEWYIGTEGKGKSKERVIAGDSLQVPLALTTSAPNSSELTLMDARRDKWSNTAKCSTSSHALLILIHILHIKCGAKESSSIKVHCRRLIPPSIHISKTRAWLSSRAF
jgi:hypothetical protein